MTNTTNHIFNGINLERYPLNQHKNLRAWDAADEYLLNTLNSTKVINPQDQVLIFNDSFGAIALTIQKHFSIKSMTVMTDSFNSKTGIINNAKTNNIDTNLFNIINSLEDFNTVFSHVLIKSPKSIDALVFFLSKIQNFITDNCNIMIAGMIKHLPKKLWDTLEENFGSTSTSLTKKKAKIINLNINKYCNINKFPITYRQNQFTIYNHASVFSKKSLDIGTRFLLENIPLFDSINEIIDLGCGNGVIGLNLAHIYPDAIITLTDESYMAVESAKLTVKNNTKNSSNIHFKVNNCLDEFPKNSADLIVCNPPFHQSHNIGIQIALTMFQQSHKTLRKNGYLIVIANRHLPYFSHLKRIFKNITTHASSNKFNIYVSKK